MKYEEFLDKLKQEEIKYYDELVKKYYELDSRRSEFQPKDETEYDKWYAYRDQLDKISSDYDVHDYSETIMKFGEDKYKTRLNNRISEHIDKLNKQIKKEIGAGISVEDKGNNTYHIEGNNGTCDIVVSPIKNSPSGNVVKTRIKISNTTKRDKPLDYVPEKEDNEYIKKWKKDELDWYNEKFKEFVDRYVKLYKEYWEASDNYQKNSYSHGEKIADAEQLKADYEEKRSKFKQYQMYNPYFTNICERVNVLSCERRGELDKVYSAAEQMFIKDINAHFKTLQAKVEAKIGEIVKIYPYDRSGANYHFEGTNGSCDVEVILAGGYNIQRLHTRWIVTRVKIKNEAK